MNEILNFLITLTMTFLVPDFSQDHPYRPSLNESGVIKDKKNSSGSYYMVNCRLFKGNQALKDFMGGHCLLQPDGTFISQIGEDYLTYMDKDQNIIWFRDVHIHHDISVNQNRGEVIVVSTDYNKYPEFKKIHSVKIYSLKSGDLIYEWDPMDAREQLEQLFGKSFQDIYQHYMERPNVGRISDAFTKINSASIIPDNSHYPKLPYLKPGNIIVNFRDQPYITIIDRDTKKVVWSLKVSDRKINGAHSVRFLKTGHLLFSHNKTEQKEFNFFERLLFKLSYYPKVKEITRKIRSKKPDKPDIIKKFHEVFYEEFRCTYELGHSKIRKYSLIENKYVWEYYSPFRFFSPYMGFSDPLPNGNILVTHITFGGAAFELTPEKKIVWEWINPERHESGFPKEIYRIMKVDEKLVQPFLKEDI